MKPLNKNPYIVAIAALTLSLLLQSCAGTSRLYPNEAPENSLRLVEVMALASKSDVQNNRYIYEPLEAAGIQDAVSREGSIGGGRVYCCGGKMDEAFFHYFYIPPEIQIDIGDIVEIRCGSLPRGGKPNVNTVTRVVEKKSDTSDICRWEPQDKIYGRVLYCDWMPEQGWVKYKGTWVKKTGP
jgi:hypothetical protein